MRARKKQTSGFVEGDLTPMIDMTFQLIAFFMVLVNFSDAAQDQQIRLPVSDLAQPPPAMSPPPVLVQLTASKSVIIAGDEFSLDTASLYLGRESRLLSRRYDTSPASVTLIIRADETAAAGDVQQLIEIAQQAGFQKFTLRALTDDVD